MKMILLGSSIDYFDIYIEEQMKPFIFTLGHLTIYHVCNKQIFTISSVEYVAVYFLILCLLSIILLWYQIMQFFKKTFFFYAY